VNVEELNKAIDDDEQEDEES